MGKSKKSKQKFEKFDDQPSPDEAMQVQRLWRKKNQELKTQCRNKIVIICIILTLILMIIIFSVSDIGKSQSTHTILPYKDSNYTLVQTNIPHLKVLLDNHKQSLQRTLIKSIGIIYSQLLSWIQAYVKPNSKILLLPADTGQNLVAISIGYYLFQNKGRLDIQSPSKQHQILTKKNLQISTAQHPNRYPVHYIKDKNPTLNSYDFIIILKSDYTILKQSTFTNAIIYTTKDTQTSQIKQTFNNINVYQLSKGQITKSIVQMGRNYGYSLVKQQQTTNNNYKLFFLTSQKQNQINICKQNIPLFNQKTQYRTLVEYFRNKTTSQSILLYGIQNKQTLTHILNNYQFSSSFSFLNPTEQDKFKNIQIPQQLPSDGYRYFILDNFSISNINKLRVNDTGILLIQNDSFYKQIYDKYHKQMQFSTIWPFTNHGCFYPPLQTKNTDIPDTPFFLVLIKQK